MSKKQVILMSLVAALPAAALLATIILNALSYGGNMFSGAMTVVVSLTGLLVLVLSCTPFFVMAWYPADGFGTPMQVPPAGAPAARPGSDDDEEETNDDEGFQSSGGGFEEDNYDDGGFEDDGLEDEYEDFDEEEWK